MSSYVWPRDDGDGWPYPDTERETIDLSSEVDDDALSVRLTPSLLNSLDPLERVLIASRYGLGGTPIRSMKQLHAELGLPRDELRNALGSGLAKLRTQLG
jgi:DNA-directed RNA polymerase sigma subunit (sigma70/sigma32)